MSPSAKHSAGTFLARSLRQGRNVPERRSKQSVNQPLPSPAARTLVKLITGSIRNPIAIAVSVLLVALFGALSLKKLPLQLFPDIERPQIGIFTNWRGAAPEEVEAELLEPQEQVLQGLPGVEEINGNAGSGGSQIFLTFAIGTDMKAALVDVIGRMSRLPPLPREVDRPFVQLGGGDGNSNDSLSFFFVQLLPGSEGPIERHRRFIEDVVKPRIESVPGVATVFVNGGPPEDVRITIDLARAAALGIGIPDIARQAGSASNVSAGQLDVGRRQFALRYTGRYAATELGQLVLAWRDGQAVRLADVAIVELRAPERQQFAYQNWRRPRSTLRRAKWCHWVNWCSSRP
jgi:multidrug efflux pump subunit AcrB